MTIITVTNTNDSGAGSLREALKTVPSGGTIKFDASLANQTIRLTSGQLETAVGTTITIEGADAPNLSISGASLFRIFYVNSAFVAPTTLTLKNLRLMEGHATFKTGDTTGMSGFGGAIRTFDAAVLNIENVTFERNCADKGGGAIFGHYRSSITVTNSRFVDNHATKLQDERGAGAIAFYGPNTLTVKDSEFVNNRGINGAAINSLNGKLTVENSRFINNHTNEAVFTNDGMVRGYGGAIYTDRSNDSTIIRNSVFEGNSSRAAGGAVHLFNDPEDTVIIETSLFKGNQNLGLPGGEPGNGGAIALMRSSRGTGTSTISNVSLINNTANNQGGAMWLMNSNTQIINATVSGNTAPNNFGGGITTYSPTEIINSTFDGNRAKFGGAIAPGPGNTGVTIRNSIFGNNTSEIPFNGNRQISQPINDGGGNIQLPANGAIAGFQQIDPKLGALQASNGLWVHPLLDGSPAINAGVTTNAPSVDGRGFVRDGQPDVGAYEVGATTVGQLFGVLPIGTPASPISPPPSGGTNPPPIAPVDNGTSSNPIAPPTNGTTTNPIAPPNAQGTPINSGSPINAGLPPSPTLNLTDLAHSDNEALKGGSDVSRVFQNGIRISDAMIVEGRKGRRAMVFTVDFTAPRTEEVVTLQYRTENGSAIAGQDYFTKSGTLVFQAGEMQKQIRIDVRGDRAIEADETFGIVLEKASGMTIADGLGIGTIVNDDFGKNKSKPATRRSDNGAGSAWLPVSTSNPLTPPPMTTDSGFSRLHQMPGRTSGSR